MAIAVNNQGVDVQKTNVRNDTILLLVMDLSQTTAHMNSMVYDNVPGSKQGTIRDFRKKFKLLTTHCMVENIDNDIKKRIDMYVNSKLKPTRNTMLYSIRLFEDVYRELQSIGKIPE